MKKGKILLALVSLLAIICVFASCQHKHQFATVYEMNDTHHWQVCEDESCTDTTVPEEHKWNDGSVSAQPTYTKEGVLEYACTVCGATKQEPISKLEPNDGSVTFVDGLNLSKAYDGNPVSLSDTDYTIVGDGELTIEWYQAEAKLDAAPTVPGEYTLKLVLASTDAYNGAEATLSFTISKAAGSVTFADGFKLNKEYDGNPVSLSDTDFTVVGDGKSTVEWYQGETKLDVPPTDAGNYTLKITVSETDLYSNAEVLIDFTISKLKIEYGTIRVDNADELNYVFCVGSKLEIDLKYTGEYADILGETYIGYTEKTSDNPKDWNWVNGLTESKVGEYAVRLSFRESSNAEYTYTEHVNISIIDHDLDSLGRCKNCSFSTANIVDITIGEAITVAWADSETVFYRIKTEIGKTYYLSNDGSSATPTVLFHDTDAQSLGEQTGNYYFRAEKAEYILKISWTREDIATTNITISESPLPYEEEGLVINELAEGKGATLTYTGDPIWLKIDNTNGKYDDYVIISNVTWSKEYTHHFEGMFLGGWMNFGIAATDVNRIEISKADGEVYYKIPLSDDVELGTVVTFDLVKPITARINYTTTTITVSDDANISNNGYAYVNIRYPSEYVFGISGDLGSVHSFSSGDMEYLGEVDGVKYYRSLGYFNMNFIIKIENEEGSLSLTKHIEHFDHADGKCICGEEISASE